MNWNNIKSIEFIGDCTDMTVNQWNQLTKGQIRAGKREVHRLVKLHHPEIYNLLALNFYNPYNYYKTKTHLILIHSGIEYFFKINY